MDWLTSKKLPNINEHLVSSKYVQDLILNIRPLDTTDGSKHVLETTLCDEDSTFTTWKQTNTIKQSDTNPTVTADLDFGHTVNTRILATRLAFLALHENQYGPARNEAIARKSSKAWTQELAEKYDVGPFDYECDPSTKYIVMPFAAKNTGFGASLKGTHLNAVHFALGTNRVLLTMNSIPYGPFAKLKRQDYNKIVSCERHDMQCVFLPMSPCVLTKNDIDRAVHIKEDDFSNFWETGLLSEKLKSEKVLFYLPTPTIAPSMYLKERYIEQISKLYSQNGAHTDTYYDSDSQKKSKKPWKIDKSTLDDIFDFIRKDTWFPGPVALMYHMRPNLKTRQKISTLLEKAIPSNFDPNSSIGLAIRDSDKCFEESKCMPFDDYMQMISAFGSKRTLESSTNSKSNGSIGQYNTIVLTSESKQILDAHLNYTNKQDFLFQFVINNEDIGQGSGYAPAFHGIKENGDTWGADDVMLSSLTSLKLQLLPESVIINGCSSFHRIIEVFRNSGCAKPKEWYTTTLNQNDNPRYRMSCGMFISNHRL
eukprot:CAMPEP_0194275556 /NCGR_PEP_ID=MMETSP0169-20130528/8357_1 /TAXON_ID=218684 /ORGANISM="Corethron pennatum, Strain L29A3" /LENGTH=537 /DNA_ID=CAMNT_0039019041 /DNA_START=270 /DNA_END=1883 /DNA_ORIENTATION=+